MPRWRVDVPGEIAKAKASLKPLERRLAKAWQEEDEHAIRQLGLDWDVEQRRVRRRVVYLRRLARRRKTS